MEARLRRGVKYKILYRGTTHRIDRTAVMVFLDYEGTDLVFSARPIAGTQHMPNHWIKEIKQVPDSTPVYINKPARNG